MVSFWTMVTAP
jgi:hypothetical protein